jgi:import inner membrane translocase subunit TIM44
MQEKESVDTTTTSTATASHGTENGTNVDKSTTEASHNEEQERPSLKDTVNRIKSEGKEGGGGTTTSSNDNAFDVDDLLRRAADVWSSFKSEVGSAWQELLRSSDRKSINKKITPVATPEGEKPYDGPVDIMVIDPSEHLTAWERMQRRLTEAPIIQEIFNRSEEIYEKSGAKKVKQRVDEVAEDAREAWETSQNPWVYRVHSVYDTLTAETAESVAVKELRELDPSFTLDDWRQDVVEHTLPMLMQWFLEGRINQLKDWFGEGVFKRVAAEITARKQEGVEIDTNVLGIMNSEILAVEVSAV